MAGREANPANRARVLPADRVENRPAGSGTTTGTATKNVTTAARKPVVKVMPAQQPAAAAGRKEKAMARRTAMATDREATVLSKRALRTGSPR